MIDRTLKPALGLLLTSTLLLAACADSSKPTPESLTETNRAIVTDFVDLFYHQRKVREAFERHVTEDYTQHNPNIVDGREAAITALEPMFSNPDFVTDIKRVIVDGDLAMVHLHAKSSPDARGGAVADIFRLEHGKIVEHWDVLQEIPANAVNPHPMF